MIQRPIAVGESPVTPKHPLEIFLRQQQGFLKTRSWKCQASVESQGKLQSCICLVLEIEKILDEMQVQG